MLSQDMEISYPLGHVSGIRDGHSIAKLSKQLMLVWRDSRLGLAPRWRARGATAAGVSDGVGPVEAKYKLFAAAQVLCA